MLFSFFRRKTEPEPEPIIEEPERDEEKEQIMLRLRQKIDEEALRRREQHLLFEALAPDITRMFEEYPKVKDWYGDNFEFIVITVPLADGFPKSHAGHIVLDENGDIDRWEEYSPGHLVFKRVTPTLSEEKRVAQLTAMLADSDSLSRYCEQVAATLLEEGSCVFNAPFSLNVKDAEYNKRYGSPEWEAAWISALTTEFQASQVIAKGNGCFQMTAM